MDDLKSIALNWLPTRPAKVILLLTATLASAPFLLPESLISEINLAGAAQLWLLKLAISLGLLLIGALVILGMVIRYYTTQQERDLADRLRRGQIRARVMSHLRD
jgi:hypothetical protein